MKKSEQFDIEEFINTSQIHKKQRREILKNKEIKRKKQIKMLKVVASSGVAVIVMSIGTVRCLPALFDTYKATTDTKDYSHSQELDSNETYKIPTIFNMQDNKDNAKQSSKKKYKITKKSVTESHKETKQSKTMSDSNDEVKLIVGGNGDDQVSQFLNSYLGGILQYYCECYGVDPYIMASIAMQESALQHESCCPGGDMYSGYGVGMCMLESPDGSLVVTAHNYVTGEDDDMVVSMENACNVEKNMQIACMEFQNSLDNFNGNPLLAIQSHNYGKDMLNVILGKNYENVQAVKNNYSDLSWLEYVKDAYYNPGKYISGWNEDTYGDGDYLAHVLSHCPSNKISYRYNNKMITYKLDSAKVIEQKEIGGKGMSN